VKCALLAAGYATRLYPLTQNQPKALLDVGGRTILDRILEKVEEVETVDEILIVTNARFHGCFEEFMARRGSRKRIRCLNDGTYDNDRRLGALADLRLVVTEAPVDDDLMVLGADNLFDFGLSDFASFFHRVHADCITTHRINDVEALRRTGVIELADDRRVLSFEEKPASPKSNFAVPPFYIYTRAALSLLDEYLDSGENPDAPGNFIPWLLLRRPVYAYEFSGRRYDIGSHESYAEAHRIFAGS
jgi:glucose-1-phosphate thymidylyltransferase